jgi:hypothetical protein
VIDSLASLLLSSFAERNIMKRQVESFPTSVPTFPSFRGGFALVILLACVAGAANGQSQGRTSATSSSIHAKHVLGFEGARRNGSGELSIQGGDLTFQQSGKPAATVSIASIHNISLGEQDNQVGGVPMMLGKTAVPFGGGRVVSLFSHKKYDSLAIEYLDTNGGFHGAIFRLAKGQGQKFKEELVTRGAQTSPAKDLVHTRNAPGEPLKAGEEWSVQVAKIDSGATALDPSFSDAIYENMLAELPKSKRFKSVFRSGDRNADDAPGVLALKMLVEKYSPGSETRRAVTTISGATKLKVRIQLLTRDNRVMLDHSVEGDVRFIGDNLRATSKVAHNTAKVLKKSTLSQPATTISQQSEKQPPPIR